MYSTNPIVQRALNAIANRVFDQVGSLVKIIVWNVSAGNAISIHMPSGRVIMIDAGASENCSPCQILYEQGFEEIHTLVVTHPHEDHVADLPTMRKLRMGPKFFLRPKEISIADIWNGNPSRDSEAVKAYIDVDGQYRTPVPERDNIFSSGGCDGVRFREFSTTKHPASDLNNRSIVVVATIGATKILFPGDCTPASMKDLLEDENFVREIKGTTILVAPHHGRQSCCCDELMGAISPKVTIISDGKYRSGPCATEYYSRHSDGVLYKKVDGGTELRYCLTTRNDGMITINIDTVRGCRVETRGGMAQC